MFIVTFLATVATNITSYFIIMDIIHGFDLFCKKFTVPKKFLCAGTDDVAAVHEEILSRNPRSAFAEQK